MKSLIVLSFLMMACAPPVPTCDVSWTCGDQACANAEGNWSGSGQFTGANDESECVAWSFVFINANQGTNRVSSCSCSN